MMDADTITRARAAVARLRGAEAGATPGPWCATPDTNGDDAGIDVGHEPRLNGAGRCWKGVAQMLWPADAAAIVALRNAAPALIRLAEAVADLVGECEEPWWSYRAASWGDPIPTCIGCGAEHPSWCFDEPWKHDGRCPALAIDAALADLAALAPQESSDA